MYYSALYSSISTLSENAQEVIHTYGLPPQEIAELVIKRIFARFAAIYDNAAAAIRELEKFREDMEGLRPKAAKLSLEISDSKGAALFLSEAGPAYDDDLSRFKRQKNPFTGKSLSHGIIDHFRHQMISQVFNSPITPLSRTRSEFKGIMELQTDLIIVNDYL